MCRCHRKRVQSLLQNNGGYCEYVENERLCTIVDGGIQAFDQANLVIIDDIMLFPIEKKHAVNLFNFINQTYENTSFIITTNKMPAEWAKMLDDEVLATALLDRLLFRCEVINLSGKSYRMENRKIIFET